MLAKTYRFSLKIRCAKRAYRLHHVRGHSSNKAGISGCFKHQRLTFFLDSKMVDIHVLLSDAPEGRIVVIGVIVFRRLGRIAASDDAPGTAPPLTPGRNSELTIIPALPFR